MEWTFTLLRCDLLDILDLILNVLGRDGRCVGGIVGWDRRPSTVACSLLYKFPLGPGLKNAKGLCTAHKEGTEKLACDASKQLKGILLKSHC